jgi:elongation factor G
MIIDRLGAKPVLIQLAIGSEATYRGLVDLVAMRQWTWSDDDLGAKPVIGDVDPDLLAEAEKAREQLVEGVAEFDDELMMLFLDGGRPDADMLKRAIRRATLASAVVPVLCGTALRNKGVQALLDAVVDYLPSPLDVLPVTGTEPGEEVPVTRRPDKNEPFCALAFKIVTDPFVGKLAFIRVYSGAANTGDKIMNMTRGKTERLGRLVLMHANSREEIKGVSAGDIAAIIGPKDMTTGDTLSDPDHPILLEPIEFPDPVIHVAIEPKSKADNDKMIEAMARLAEEDPTFQIRNDQETGQTLIYGMGELHLEVIVDRMRREFKVEANVGKPQVAYRETITQPAKNVEGRFVRQTGGRGQYGHVIIDMTPNEPGGGITFENATVGGTIPREYIAPVEQGTREALKTGLLSGFAVVDVHVALRDGSYHDVDSSEAAFKVAASLAVKEALQKGRSVLLEPVMKVEVVAPEEYTGDCMGDLNSRRGQIDAMEPRAGGVTSIRAFVPLAEMFGYASDLRSMTQGRGTFTMEFARYERVPEKLSQAVAAERSKA